MIDIEKNTETQKDLKFRLSLKFFAQLTNNNDNYLRYSGISMILMICSFKKLSKTNHLEEQYFPAKIQPYFYVQNIQVFHFLKQLFCL